MTRTHILFAILFLFSVKVTAQKVVLQLDGTPSSIPSVSKAELRYNKNFAYSFTFDDCSIDHYTVARPLFLGGVVPNSGYTSPGLFFTDGCGNDIPFKGALAWNSTNIAGYGPNTNDETYVSWTQLQEFYNLGWDVLNHTIAHRAWDLITGSYTYANQITQNNDAVRSHLNIEMPCFVVPSGDYNYQDVALQQGHKAVFDQNFPQGGISFFGIPVDGNANMTNLKAYRERVETQIDNPIRITTVADRSIGGVHLWYNEFVHHIDIFDTNATFNFYKFKDYMLNIANVYGKNGSDRVWFAPLQEVYEYVISRQNTDYNVALTSDNKLEITLNVNNVPNWLRRKTVTLVVNSDVNFSNVKLPQGIKATWKGTGNNKLINLDFTNFSSPVPVELVSFKAEMKDNNSVNLSWVTASERSFYGFDIEKSLDGKTYTPIGFVKAKGTASNYTFADEYFSKTSYYRLRMADIDGTSDYSRVVSVLVNSKNKVQITPSVSDQTISIETDFDEKMPATIEIFDQSGKLMMQKKASNSNLISTESFPQGIYFVRVNYGLDFWVRKIVKF